MKVNLIKRIEFKIFITVLSVYLFYIAPGYSSSNTTRYIMLAKAVVNDKTFAIDNEYEGTRDWSYYNGHHYVGAAPGLGLMAAPAYFLSRPLLKILPVAGNHEMEYGILSLFFSFLFAALPGAIIAVLLYSLLKEFNLRENEKLLLVFASAFGTILFYYSTRFLAHVMGAFLLFGAFYILFKARHGSVPQKWLMPFLAGICIGFSVLTEYTLSIGAVLLTAYALFDFRKLKLRYYAYMACGLVLPALLFMYYHYECFNNPFSIATKYSRMIGPIPFAMPKLNIIYELLFGTYRGMFLYMPVLLPALYGIYIFFKAPQKKFLPEMLVIAAFFLSIFFTICLFCNVVWPWGGDFGPRFFVCLIPFLMIPLAHAYKKIGHTFIFWIIALSVFVNWCGVQYGDADSVFTDIGLFICMGLNSNMAEWLYAIVNTYVKKFNVVTHFSPFLGFIVLAGLIFVIWKDEITKSAK